jgi:tetratricopeptide (TPR) repeat protein
MLTQKKKTFYYIVCLAAGLALILLIINLVINNYYRSRIPPLPELQSLSVQLHQQIEDASKNAHHNPSAYNIGMLGMIYHSSAYYEQAKQCYQLAVRKTKSKWIWNYYLGYLNQEMGETNSSIENFKEVIKEYPKNYFAYYYIGEGYRNLGINNKAEAAFNKIPATNAKDNNFHGSTRNDFFSLQTYARFQLARIYVNTNRTDEAIKILSEIIMENHSYGPAYRLMGSAYNNKGDTSAGKYYIVRANDLAVFGDPIDTLIDRLAQISKSDIYVLKQIDEAFKSFNTDWTLELIKNALQNIPENKYLISKATKTYLILDNGNLALPLLTKHFEYFKEDFSEIKEIAEQLSQKGYYKQSVIYYEQVVKLKPDDPEIQISMMISLWEEGEKSKALEMMTRLADKNKMNSKVLADLVNAMIAFGENATAKSYFSVLKQISPANQKLYRLSGMLAEQDGDFNQAIRMYEKAYQADHGDLTNVQYLCNNLIQQKNWGKAINYLKEALNYHPNDPFLLERLGTLLISCPDIKLRNAALAKEYSERAFNHVNCPSETMVTAGRSLGVAYATLGDRNNAYKYISITLQLARNENSPTEVQEDLKNLLQRLSSNN